MEVFVAALCILAVSLPLAALGGRRNWANMAGAGGAFGGCALGLVSLLAGPWSAPVLLELPWGLPAGAGLIGLDPLTRIFLMPTFGLGAVCALSGAAHLAHALRPEHNPGAHWAFYLLLVLAQALVLAARDAVPFLLAWELMSFAPFFLIEFDDHDPQVRKASWIYLVAAHLGAVCLFGVFGLMWARTGATSFDAFTAFPTGAGSVLFVLALAGFGAKTGIAPFHVWLPEAHPAAPSHISAMLSGAMISVGLYGLARSLTFFGAGNIWWGWILIGAGVGTGLLGILKALGQGDLKRLLAYHSVENMGIALIGIGTGYLGTRSGSAWMATLGYSAAFFHILNNAAMKGLLFLCAGEVLHSAHSVRLGGLGGLQKRMPWTGAAFVTGATAISCLPPLSGFAGKFLLILALLEGSRPYGPENQLAAFGAIIALVFMGGLTAAAFAKAYGIGFLGEPRSEAARNAVETGRLNRACLFILVFCCLGLALAAPSVFGLLSSAALSLFPAGLDQAAGARAAAEARETLSQGLFLSFGLLALTAALWLLRAGLLKRNGGTREARTWDCGCQIGTPRMQYTAASFVRPLSRLFSVIVGLARRHERWGGLFPSREICELRPSGGLLDNVFTPLFEGVRRLCDRLKIVQHGRIHIYILYILAVIVGLLVWGLL